MSQHLTHDHFYPSMISQQIRKFSTFYKPLKINLSNQNITKNLDISKRPRIMTRQNVKSAFKPLKTIRSKSLTESIKLCKKQLQQFQQNFTKTSMKSNQQLQKKRSKSHLQTLTSYKKNLGNQFEINSMQNNKKQHNQNYTYSITLRSKKLQLANFSELKENITPQKKRYKRKKEDKKNNLSFGSSSKRFSNFEQTYQSIGPGTYHNYEELTIGKNNKEHYYGYNSSIPYSKALANIYMRDYQKQIKNSSVLVLNPKFKNELLRDSRNYEQQTINKIIHTGSKKITIDDYNLFRKRAKSEKSFCKPHIQQIKTNNINIQKLDVVKPSSSKSKKTQKLDKLPKNQQNKNQIIFTKKSEPLMLINFKEQANTIPSAIKDQTGKQTLQQQQENKISPMYIKE